MPAKRTPAATLASQPIARRRVIFRIEAPPGADAAVAGSFNEWKLLPLKESASAPKTLAKTVYLPTGKYEYKFVVNGTWMHDDTCPDQIPNPYGTVNSLLRVP
jgi:1,4-alpha-glucan branching enzyme